MRPRGLKPGRHQLLTIGGVLASLGPARALRRTPGAGMERRDRDSLGWETVGDSRRLRRVSETPPNAKIWSCTRERHVFPGILDAALTVTFWILR